MSRRFLVISSMASFFALAQAGCSDSGSPPVRNEEPPFVAITRARELRTPGVQSAALSVQSVPGADSATTFYLAISKKALHEKWFLSAFLKQFYPAPVENGAAKSLGTRVVTFRERNDMLYVFDASDNHASSDAFDPALMIESYPIVQADVAGAPGKYVVVDPAAGLNRFGLADAASEVPFKVDLAFMQNFRPVEDGAAFEQIFSGSSAQAALRGSGTLGLSFRRYSETPSFQAMDAEDLPFYFTGDERIVRNAGGTSKRIWHWAIRPGMKPIRWTLSKEFTKLQKQYPEYDIVGAVQRGITNWNEVFGFEALTAELANDETPLDDDDKNFILFDADPHIEYAFANMRTNPNTGEIRGASVYFNAIWLQDGDPGLAADPGGAPKITGWSAFRQDGLCAKTMPRAASLQADPTMTKKQKVEAYITHVILHEIGHTLGLRHNFKGSLVPRSSSVMDYLTTADSVRLTTPGPYDRDAMRYLHGLAPDRPAQSFCTDEQVSLDPECARGDASDDPLNKDAGPNYRAEVTAFITGKPSDAKSLDDALNRLVKWLRVSPPADVAASARLQTQKLAAWDFLTAPLRSGATPGALAEKIDAAWLLALNRLYFDAPEQRDPKVFATQDPPKDAALSPKIAQDAANILIGAHDMALRRVIPLVLKKLQTDDAHAKLLAARTAVEAQKGTGPAAAAENAKLDDLLARIDQASRPYYE